MYFRNLVFIFLLVPVITHAQIAVTFPLNRIVLQRNNANQTKMQIAGTYYQAVDKVEAKLTPVNGGNLIDWTTIQQSPSGGAFAGALTVSGGWYTLEVRGSYQGNVVATDRVDRVGVGEVFVVAGQSNARGVPGTAIPDPSDERISIADGSNYEDGFPSNPQSPAFKRMTAGSNVLPNGPNSWYWGMVGEILTRRLNVPVLFYNAATDRTTVKNWRESSEGIRTQNRYCTSCGEAGYYPQGIPYDNLKNTLNYYCSLTGVRGVLWHQGEADDKSMQTTTASYVSDLTKVIAKSRSDFGYGRLSWMVSRVSYNSGTTWPATINAQNQVIASVSDVFPGPSTDGIDIPRVDPPYDVHFHGEALPTVAQAWGNSLTDAYFANTAPMEAADLLGISAACAGTNTLTLTVPGQTPYAWSNGATGSNVTVGQGTYFAKVKSGNKTRFSAPYKVPSVPTINSNDLKYTGGNAYYCEGSSPVLTSSYNTGNTWSTGATTQSISLAPNGGSYSLKYKDVLGCEFASGTVQITQRSRPAKPSISADGSTTFCEGTGRNLSVDQNASSYLWSNGSNNKTIQPSTSGVYTAQIVDEYQCTSPASDGIQVTVNPAPAKPSITASRTISGGSVSLCDGENVTLTSSASESGYNWNYQSQTSAGITVNQNGSFQVQTISKANCYSPWSDAVGVKVNPLPAKPTTRVKDGLLAFCEGKTVTLEAITDQKASWVSGTTQVSDNATLKTGISGTYYAQATDQNNCKNLSDPVTVSSRPNPQTPTIVAISPYTLQAKADIPGTQNSWFIGEDTLTFNSVYFKPLKEGTYRVSSVIRYTVDTGSFTCFSAVSQPYTFAYNAGADNFIVYPNFSTTGDFTLETKDVWKNADVSVTTMNGTVIYQGRVTEFNERKFLRLGTQPGVYILRIQTATETRTKRLVVRP
jgi:hypothetical protein